jgi:hypothetical protein
MQAVEGTDHGAESVASRLKNVKIAAERHAVLGHVEDPAVRAVAQQPGD